METSPTSAMQMSPRFSAMAFMVSYAPRAGAAFKEDFPDAADESGFFFKARLFYGDAAVTARSYQGMVLCIITRLLFIWKTFFYRWGQSPCIKSS